VWQVEISDSARRRLRKLPKAIQETISRRIDWLRDNADFVQYEKLVGSDECSLHVGQYRILYLLVQAQAHYHYRLGQARRSLSKVKAKIVVPNFGTSGQRVFPREGGDLRRRRLERKILEALSDDNTVWMVETLINSGICRDEKEVIIRSIQTLFVAVFPERRIPPSCPPRGGKPQSVSKANRIALLYRGYLKIIIGGKKPVFSGENGFWQRRHNFNHDKTQLKNTTPNNQHHHFFKSYVHRLLLG
jgi:mRNA-degrading endonuclease RelE of RelBE toxin-antitoxin system